VGGEARKSAASGLGGSGVCNRSGRMRDSWTYHDHPLPRRDLLVLKEIIEKSIAAGASNGRDFCRCEKWFGKFMTASFRL